MSRLLAAGGLAFAALFVGAVWIATIATDAAVADRRVLRAELDSLRNELNESRSAFNALAGRFSTIEQRCVAIRRRSSRRP